MMNRRHFVHGALSLGGALAGGLRPVATLAAEDLLVLTAGEKSLSLAVGELPESPFWFYNDQTPGPEIRVRKDQKVRVRLVNKLPEPTTIHWHGIRIANAMDGVPGLTQEPVEPGGTFDYEFVAPDAGTYWYHAHNRSWNQVARGLYGPLIIEDADEAFDAAHDLTLVLDDWRINREGELDLASMGSMMDWSHAGRLGNIFTVNGTIRPEFEVNAGESYRLRLINVSNARIFTIDPVRFGGTILAYDGQTLPERMAAPAGPLQLASAQRIDLLITPGRGQDFPLEVLTRSEPVVIAEFKVSGDGAKTVSPPKLAPNDLSEPDLSAARRIALDMTGGAMGNFVETTYNGKTLTMEDMRTTRQVWAFNGVANLADAPLFSARRGESIVIEAANRTAFPHAVHVHGHHFRVIESGQGGDENPGPWRDTVLINPDQTMLVAFVADNPGKWLLHCHMLEHAAAGMNTWFEVL